MNKLELSNLCHKALIKEVELTPKPGLVDKNNNGSHKDMNLSTFYKSADAIKPFIEKFVNANDFNELRKIGQECEKAMFEATSGVNTHKGMIFSLAVISNAFYRVKKFDKLQNEIKKLCKDLYKDFSDVKNPKTNGERFYKETKNLGIRGEAMSGYATIFEKSLPFYEKKLKLYGEDTALKMTLLYLMSFIDDTTVFARGGLEGLAFVKNESKKILHVENLDANLLVLDSKMIEKNLSAGGSADLLALTWLIYQAKIL
ncbi:triphosphoribosyl-dephospho-CoA synthase [Sulfurospirillum sp. 1307]